MTRLDPGFVAAVADLRTDWPNLSDVDRALRISPIIVAGSSGRTLAKAIGQKESSLRHIRPLTEATEEEKVSIRRGEVSTNSVLRSIKGRLALQHQVGGPSDVTHNQAARTWAERIIYWVTGEIGPIYGRQVVGEARLHCAKFGDQPVPYADGANGMPLATGLNRNWDICSLGNSRNFRAFTSRTG